MLAFDLAAFERAENRGALTVFDCGFPDILGFLHLGETAVPPELLAACWTQRYEGPIIRAPAWREVYRTDPQRTQNWTDPQASDAAVSAAWRGEGYRLLDLPLDTVQSKAKWLVRLLPIA